MNESCPDARPREQHFTVDKKAIGDIGILDITYVMFCELDFVGSNFSSTIVWLGPGQMSCPLPCVLSRNLSAALSVFFRKLGAWGTHREEPSNAFM